MRPQNARVVHINLDETCVKMFTPPKAGLVNVPHGTKPGHFLERELKVSLRKQRSAITWIAFASNDLEASALLPQVLIVNKRLLPRGDLEVLRRHISKLPACRLLVRDSAWVNVTAMMEVMAILRDCLLAMKPYAHVILTMDCCPVHTSPRLLRRASAYGFFCHFIPACMTSLLQPLDTSIFAKVKRFHRSKVEHVHLLKASGETSFCEIVMALVDVIAEVMIGKPWPHEFLLCGLGGHQGHLSNHLRRALGLATGPQHISDDLPELSDLQAIWPRGKSIPLEALFAGVKRLDAESCRASPLVRLHTHVLPKGSVVSPKDMRLSAVPFEEQPPLPPPALPPPSWTPLLQSTSSPRSSLQDSASSSLLTGAVRPARMQVPVGHRLHRLRSQPPPPCPP